MECYPLVKKQNVLNILENALILERKIMKPVANRVLVEERFVGKMEQRMEHYAF